jgi:hypothetical protein
MRAEGRAKHLPEASRRFVEEPDAHAQVHEATVAVLDRLLDLQELVVDEIAGQGRAHKEMISRLDARSLRPEAPREEKIRKWDFAIERDDEGRIKKVVARA